MKQHIMYGCHTYSVGTVLTYNQFKKIWDACYTTGCIEDTSNILKHRENLYCYAHIEQGVRPR